MKRFFPLLVLTAGLVLGAGTTAAAPPVQGTDEFLFDCCFPDGFCPIYNCGTEADPFLICETADIDFRYKYFLSNDEEFVRYWEQQKLTGGLYAVDDPENFLPYNPLTLTYKFDFVSLEEVVTGVWALITVPGYGQIFKDVGRVVWDADGNVIFEAGEHQYFNDDFEAVCDYMMNH